MTHIGACMTWLLRAPIGGIPAFLYGLAAIAVPTLIRVAVDGVVSGTALALFPYIPFVLLSALLLEWRYAVGGARVCHHRRYDVRGPALCVRRRPHRRLRHDCVSRRFSNRHLPLVMGMQNLHSRRQADWGKASFSAWNKVRLGRAGIESGSSVRLGSKDGKWRG